jgi:hypothetical protein
MDRPTRARANSSASPPKLTPHVKMAESTVSGSRSALPKSVKYLILKRILMLILG